MAQIKFIEVNSLFAEKDIFKSPMRNMHHHNAFELYYIIKGEREYFIEDEFFKLNENDLVIIDFSLEASLCTMIKFLNVVFFVVAGND